MCGHSLKITNRKMLNCQPIGKGERACGTRSGVRVLRVRRGRFSSSFCFSKSHLLFWIKDLHFLLPSRMLSDVKCLLYNLFIVPNCFLLLDFAKKKQETVFWRIPPKGNSCINIVLYEWHPSLCMRVVISWKNWKGWNMKNLPLFDILDIHGIPQICHGRYRRRPCKFFWPV